MLYEKIMRSDYFLDRSGHGHYDVPACVFLERMHCDFIINYRI